MHIPGYKIIRQIGSGGMAVVYLAQHEKLGNQFAIKVLSDVLVSNKSVRERFIQEARMMVSLRHSGIVTVTDFIETDRYLAIVMDYIEGRSLDEMIGNEVGPIPHEKALPIFLKILEAVSYAHSKGIIHRDLKPANILVSKDGEVKVADFGIAKIAGQNGLTKTGVQMGTLYYESPEQIMGAGNVDQRTDIYSLGMTLFEMLAGRLPFDDVQDTSEYKIMDSIVKRDQAFDPRVYYPHVPEWLVKVVQKALELSVEDRILTCDSFIKMLSQHEMLKVDSHSYTEIDHFQQKQSLEKNPLDNSRKSEILGSKGKTKTLYSMLLIIFVIIATTIIVTKSGNSKAVIIESEVVTENEEYFEEPSYPAPVIQSATSYSYCEPINQWTYDPNNLFDGNWNNAWCANYVPGDSWFTLFLQEESLVHRIGIVPGYVKANSEISDLFNKNYRIRTVRIIFDSGRDVEYTFQDIPSMQYIEIEPSEVTYRITVYIESVYPTLRYEDIAISEVSVQGE